MAVGETIPDKIRSYFEKESKGTKLEHLSVLVSATVILPTLIGILSSTVLNDGGYLLDWPPDSLSVVFLILILAQMGCAYLVTVHRQGAPTYYDFIEVEQTHQDRISEVQSRFERTRSNLNRVLQMQEAARYASMALGNVEPLSAEDGDTSNDLEQGIALVLDSCVSFKAQIFGFKAETLYNFAVYLYNEDEEILRVAWRECDPRINRQDRDWRPREGHVGMCFATRKELFSNNVLESDELNHDDPEDEEKYVSMVSIPIFHSGDFPDDRNGSASGSNNTKPIGVFIVTSNVSDQFDRDLHKTFLLSLSYHLSFVIERIRERNGNQPD